jgi:hypothetical protein
MEFLFFTIPDPALLQTMFEMIMTAWPHDCSGMLHKLREKRYVVNKPIVHMLDEMILCGADEKIMIKSALKKR